LVPLDRDHRPPVAGQHDLLLDRGLESIVMGGDNPGWVVGGFNEFDWDPVVGTPELDRIIINGIRAAQDCGAGIGGIAVSANDF
jgi:hypothetical protein